MKIVFFGVIIGLVLTVFGSVSYAADPVIRVLVVKSDHPAAYVQELETGKKILKKLKAKGEIRVWYASFAGPETGTVVVTVEWKDLSEFAADSKKINGSEEMTAWVKGLDALRTILSDSLYNELKAK
ncbi:MAG: hypothetical protein COB54_02890 [Alphaproteobacteria bacterium]|nr:MAG: hypothetical protein COB54_02890 [Alphaproteobacteria bacterium]